MKHISILVPEGAILGSLEGSRHLFSQVNDFFKERGEPPVFKVQLVGMFKQTQLSGGLFTVNADVLLKDVEK
ncbi:MAG: AraC family transcriptional regulator, partial [Chitinophagaceae bacterium]